MIPAAIMTKASIMAKKYVGRKKAKSIPQPKDDTINPSAFNSALC